MKTIKEVAALAGISKTSVYNLIKRYDIPTHTVKKVTYLDNDGIQIIGAHYQMEIDTTIDDIVEETTTELELDPTVPEEYLKLVDILQEQLHKKDETIAGLLNVVTLGRYSEIHRLTVSDNAPANDYQPPRVGLWTRFISFFKRGIY